jgi:hypothetical protein
LKLAQVRVGGGSHAAAEQGREFSRHQIDVHPRRKLVNVTLYENAVDSRMAPAAQPSMRSTICVSVPMKLKCIPSKREGSRQS